MSALRRTAAGAALLAAGLVAAVALVGRDRLWSFVAGPADLGAVRFETLERRPYANDALACPPELCSAHRDIVPPVFAVDARELRVRLAQVLAAEPRLQLADADDLVPSERYVQRSALLRFPDTIDVRFLDRGDGRSTLALYSRSQIGRGDMGVNRARLERWLAGLARAAPVAAP